MKLRPYQRQCLDSLYDWFRQNTSGHPIVNACVGAGKSIMLAQLCHDAVNGFEGRARLLMIVPSKELCEQNMRKLQAMTKNIRFGVISASLGRKDFAHDKDVIIGTIGSLHKKGGKLGYFDLVLIDECHFVNRAETGMYRQLINDLLAHNSRLRVIGWTGTPFRGNGIWLTEGKDALFNDIAAHVGMSQLLQEGFLAPLVVANSDTQISADNVKTNGGDYVIAELAQLLDRNDLTIKIAGDIIRHGKDRNKWLVYCVTVEHATHMAEALTDRGIATVVVSAKTHKTQRESYIARFRAGRIRCICNVAVLTTGFDVPEVDMIALVRNTKSPVLYVQIAGRGMRTAPGKNDCLWLDFTDTTARMGPVNHISGRPEPKAKERIDDAASQKLCPECGAVAVSGQTACALCGHAFQIAQPKLNSQASSADILLIGKKLLPVDDVWCHSAVSKKSGKPYLSVRAMSGLQSHSKNLMLGFEGYAGQIARIELSRLLSPTEAIPDTVDAAMRAFHAGIIEFREFSHMEVDFDSPYKEITRFIEAEV